MTIPPSQQRSVGWISATVGLILALAPLGHAKESAAPAPTETVAPGPEKPPTSPAPNAAATPAPAKSLPVAADSAPAPSVTATTGAPTPGASQAPTNASTAVSTPSSSQPATPIYAPATPMNEGLTGQDTGVKAKIVRIPGKGKFIRDLAFRGSSAQVKFLSNAPGAEPVVYLEGKFARQGWNLVFDTIAVFTPKAGKEYFSINIPIRDDITPVKVTAVGPRGEAEEEKFFVQIAGGRKALADFLSGKKEDEIADDGPRKAEWSIINRLAQAMAAYTTDNKDKPGTNGSGAAAVALVSSELRWRGGKDAGQRWTWSGSLNFEMIRQIVTGTQFFLPRGYARLFYGKEEGTWRYGPFLQVHAGNSGLFITETTTSALKAVVTRKSIGAGGVAVWRPSKGLGLSALALLRRDTGGTADTLPNPLNPAISWEAGFGVVMGLNPKWLLEGRLRALQENKPWTALNGKESSVIDTYIILDVGLGYKF